MSDPLLQSAPAPSPEALGRDLAVRPVSERLARQEIARQTRLPLLGYLQQGADARFDAHRGAVFGREYANELSPDEANERFGVDDYLTFETPVNAHTAAFQHQHAIRRRFTDEVTARSGISQLEALGASMGGALTDPAAVPFYFAGGGGTLATRLLGTAARGTRVANAARGAAYGAGDGLVAGAAFEGLSWAVLDAAGDDYGAADFLIGVTAGTVFSAGVGGAIGAVQRPVRQGVQGGAGGGARAARPTGRVPDMIAATAARLGEDAETALRIAELESAFDPNARNPSSSASGVYQFLSGTWNDVGGGDVFDPALNIQRGVELQARNRQGLRRALGREPEPWELYLAHQQGLGGAVELLRDPNRRAVDALTATGMSARRARSAIGLNAGEAGMTAGAFAARWRDRFGGATGRAGPYEPPARPARILAGLSENERIGAGLEALDALIEDRPLDLDPLLRRTGAEALDEASAVPTISGRWLEAGQAITRRGTEIPVRYGLVELDDLTVSHTGDLSPNPDFPAVLQPRDRSRAGAQAENYALERDLNPALLMRDVSAAGGAPIVSPGGLVESGNGRLIALKRSADTDQAAWGRYRQELARQGFDAEGMERPVLVRMRTEPLSGETRAALAREMNLSPTKRFSATEQANVDAGRLDAATLSLLDGDDPFAAANRPFLRGFMQRVAGGDANALTGADGRISQEGRQRVRAALVQKAYGDARLTAALFETGDPEIAAVGRALADAAPAWARMRAEAPADMDLTANLVEAVELVRHARSKRLSVGEIMRDRLGQSDLFGAEALSPETGAMLGLMFRDEALTRARGADSLAAALKDYANGAAATTDGPDLFGVKPDGRAFLETLNARYRAEPDRAYAGQDGWTTREADAPVLDLRPAEPGGRDVGSGPDGPQAGGRPAGDGGADGERAGLDGIVAAAEADGIKLRVSETDAKINLALIVVPAERRDGGVGSQIMQQLADYADRTQKRMTLTPSSDFGGSVPRLRAFYKRFGFVENKGRNRDFEISDSMYREPGDAPAPEEAAPSQVPAPPQAPRPLPPELANDPELKAIVADTEALAAQGGVTMPAPTAAQTPETIAEAVRAAAFCLVKEAGL